MSCNQCKYVLYFSDSLAIGREHGSRMLIKREIIKLFISALIAYFYLFQIETEMMQMELSFIF